MNRLTGLAMVVVALAVATFADGQPAPGETPASPLPGSAPSALERALDEASPGDLQSLIFRSSNGSRTGGIWSSNSSLYQGTSRRIAFANDPPDAAANTSASAPPGAVRLTFATVPALAVSGGYVMDLTHPAAIAPGTTISGSPTATAITLSAGVASPGVSSGDQILFYGPRFMANQVLRAGYLINDGSTKVGVADLEVCNALTSYSKCQTTNLIALSTARHQSHVQLNAVEYDLEAADDTNSYDSLMAIAANIFGAKGGTVLQTGGIAGGNWNLGFKMGGMAPAGIALIGGASEPFGSLVDTQNGAYGYSAGAILLNNYGDGTGAGAGQFVGFRGTSCCSAQVELYNDGSRTFRAVNFGGGIALAPAQNYPVSIGPFLRTTPVTYADLTRAYDTSPAPGDRAVITDATACAFNTSVSGGGSTPCPVVYLGGTWKAG